MPEFDAKYIDIENAEEIYEIMNAAKYLDIRALFDLSCAKIASLIKGVHLIELSYFYSLLP